ncbi:hypothetical protein M9H77_29847 [Catharanthus roseus]|uniref:Uncharacterized protein n=1 Tax=Catharanthus roseus TaxID=4058 RepID=A0ACB9ZVL4_CATRO|nr:hypothetical protein M9H77_29847 [Catharanthus roseus]
MKNPVNASSSECLKNLSWVPSKIVKSFNRYFVNGFRFHIQEREDFDINETSRRDVDVQDIGTLVHESGELESMKMTKIKMKKRSNGSPMMKRKKKRKRKSFNRKEDGSPKDVYWSDYEVYTSGIGSIPLRTSDSPTTTSTPLASASIPPRTSASPATTSTPLTSTSIPLGTSASPATMSTPLATLTPFLQLLHSSPASISNPFSSSATEMSSRPAPSSSARPSTPPV